MKTGLWESQVFNFTDLLGERKGVGVSLAFMLRKVWICQTLLFRSWPNAMMLCNIVNEMNNI